MNCHTSSSSVAKLKIGVAALPVKPSLASSRARPGRLNQIIARIHGCPAFAACNNPRVTDVTTDRRPLPLAILLVIGGFLGFLAAFELTLDKFQVLEHPATSSSLSCDFSVVVQCSKNLASPEGSAFGFPNPVIGLAGYFALIVVGMTLLAGARLARWYWLTLNVGVLFALSFVIFLITKSIFHLGTLCPWCMVVWSATIPIFFAVTFYNLSVGNIPIAARGRAFFTSTRTWIPLITLACYVIIAIIAQARLDVLRYL
jgi:uncharacterized membrane protein